MTLNDILVAALLQLNRGHDSQTLDVWRDKFTNFANEAQEDLSFTVKPRKKEKVEADEDGVISLKSLSRRVRRVLKVFHQGREIPFFPGEVSESIKVKASGECEVEYIYSPKELRSPSDVSELPAICHPLIVTYVVARERLSGDISTQGGAAAYLQLYQAQKSKLRGDCGEEESYRLKVRWPK